MDARQHFRNGLLVKSLAFLLLAGVVFTPQVAHAASYSFDLGSNNNFTSAQTIANPQDLQYVYGIIGAGEDTVDYYELEFKEYTPQVHIELLVKDTEALNNFKPSLVLVDSKLDHMIGTVPFGFPLSVGGRVFGWDSLPEKTHTDEAILENFRVGPALIRDMAEGEYRIAVFDPQGKGGNYVLRIGAKEPRADIRAKFAAFIALIRIKFGLY